MFVGVIEFLGWFGAVTVLAGYLLFSLGKIPNGPVYQLFNLVGGVSVAVNVAAHHAVPSTIVNSIWAVVAAVVLVRMGLRRAHGRRDTGPSENRLPDLHSELPATTAVLPVIGPALRDHDGDVTTVADAAPSLPAVAVPVPGAGAGVGASTGTGTGTDAPAPMTESVPVITATIALALVRAATQQHATQQHATQQHRTGHDTTPRPADHAPEPERADAP
ncbi:hypothetical protein DEJ33_01945 [Curtobacterium sp. MCPF17_047]|uniref:CBU_0592 family membrane protein n=1 Tax=Curtobacterium sp. MCPF17_047 TaxID=2175654 RepID=UPI000DAA76BF|nr:hypothetical protein [Curtobacterium sp. MCPF17_047]PZF69144.1 hypothetical protein DEJ33_01945 [Curtobacterium sp. MCPF17_047]